MDAKIHQAESKSFSGEDIHRLCDGEVVVRKYSDLAKFRTLDDALGKHRAMVVLYETKPGYGHWCAIFAANDKFVEFFDPYGYAPDEELGFVPSKMKARQPPYLSDLISKSPYSLVFNQEELQSSTRDMNTCGRWCGLRICLRKIPLDKFIALFRGQMFEPDWYVSALTMFV